MRRNIVKTSIGVAVALVIITAVAVLAQPDPGTLPAAPGPWMMAGWPPAPATVVVVADGIVYVACDGTLTALDAKTLKKVGEAVYWERPEFPE